MSAIQSAAIKAWWDRRRAAGLVTPKEVQKEKRRASWRAEAARRYAANPERQREIARRSMARRREAVNAKRRAERAANPEAFREKDRAAYAARAERINQCNRERYAKNPTRVLAKNTKWRERNKDWHREAVRRRDALKAQTIVEVIDYGQMMRESGGVCAVCCKPLDLFGYHFDHKVPLARGGTHTRDNIQVTHARCNLKKWAHVA